MWRGGGVDSGKGVDSSEYGVDSKDRNINSSQSSLNTNYSLLTTDANSNTISIGEKNGDTQLSRIDCVAEGDGAGQRGLFDKQGVPEGGNLFSDESDTPSGCVSSVEHSRGRGKEVKGRLSSIPEHSQGISGRSGNTDRSGSDAKIYKERTDNQYSEYLHRDEQTVNRTSKKSEEVGGGEEEVDSREYLVDSKDRNSNVSQSSLTTNYLIPTTIPISEPTEIKVMDPSCGSGHILVYAFDILYKIYEEEGYTIGDIPSLILKNNLFGVDIDDRAAALAAFALAMKARDRDRAFFEKGIVPNVIASQEVDVSSGDVRGITFSQELKKSFDYLKDAKNLGSLIPVSGGVAGEIAALQEKVKDLSSDDFFEKDKIEQLGTGLKQLEYLSPHYHCVITNPPYMGGKGMNQKLKDYIGKHYSDSKSDLFAVFMEKGLELSVKNGYMGMINQQSWMFLSSYEKLRKKMINENTIITMTHLGARAFDSIGGEVVQTTAFIIENTYRAGYEGAYIRLIDGKSEAEKEKMFKEAIK